MFLRSSSEGGKNEPDDRLVHRVEKLHSYLSKLLPQGRQPDPVQKKQFHSMVFQSIKNKFNQIGFGSEHDVVLSYLWDLADELV